MQCRNHGSSQSPDNRSEKAKQPVILPDLVDNAVGPIFTLDRQYQYTSFNRAHAEVMKSVYGADIEMGHSLAEYMSVREDWDIAKANIDRALKGEAFLDSAYSGVEGQSRRFIAVIHNPIRTSEGEVAGVAVFAWDVTDRRKEQERALRESEKRFRTVADFTYDWEFWLFPDGSLSYVSPSCERITGYAAEEFQQDPKLLLRIVHPEDRKKIERHLDSCQEDSAEERCEMDFRIFTRSGQERWLSHACLAVRDKTGSYLGRRASQRDITERKIRETEMRTLQMAIESVAASIVITNRDGIIEYVNSRFTDLTGYSFEESVGRNPRFLKDPEKPSTDYKELWDSLTSGQTWTGTFRNVRKNGAYYLESATISPVMDESGRIVRFVAVKEDITAHRQAELALRDSEEKFRQLVKKTPLPLCFVNREGNVGYLNDRFSEVFGYTREDLPTIAEWWRLAYPDETYRQWVRDQWESACGRAIADGKDIEAGEYKVTCKNGEMRTVLISGIIMEENVLATFTDITERRRQERLLKASYERKKKNEILTELVQERLPSKQILKDSARMLGMRVIEPFNCFLAVVDEYRGKSRGEWTEQSEEYQQLIDSLVDELADETCITWESSEGIGVLCFDTMPATDRKADQIRQAEKIRNTIIRTVPETEVSVGIAERSSTLTEVGNHYRQAVVAVNTGRRVWPQAKIYHYLDIGVFQLLPYLQDQKQIDAYIERTLGNLLRYDKKKRVEYTDTLALIIESDNLKEAASQLGIHYKSLMFRKQRLEEILGVSLDVFASRMAVATAVHLMKLRDDKQ